MRRRAELPIPTTPTLDDWYCGEPGQPLVPGVVLEDGIACVCPYCRKDAHLHEQDGICHPPCNGPRARYVLRGMPPAHFVNLLLRRLGFTPAQVTEIMATIAAGERSARSSDSARQVHLPT